MSKNYDEQKIVDYYLQYPMSIEELHEEFSSLCTVTLSRCLKRHGLNLYSRQDILTRDVNIHYFDIIDSEEKAYLCGLFNADGCVYTKGTKAGNLFNIQLQKQDGYMIDFIKERLNINRQVVIDKRDESCSISLVNNYFVSKLMSLGITEGKDNRFMPKVPNELKRHWLRGLFDGDGSITIKKRSARHNVQYCVIILGHSQLINQVKAWLINELNISDNKLCSDGGDAYSIRLANQRDFLAVTNYMYENATIYLTRKYNKYQAAVQDLYSR